MVADSASFTAHDGDVTLYPSISRVAHPQSEGNVIVYLYQTDLALTLSLLI